LGAIVAALVAAGMIGQVSGASAQGRPTYVLVFVPVAWSGNMAAFDRAADAGAGLFVTASGIDRFATVRVVKLHDVLPADLADVSLHSRVAEFGIRRAAGDRYIGLTDGDLAPRGRQGVAGWTTMFGNGIIAESHHPSHVAHELGHTFGLCDEYEFGAWAGSNGRGACPNPFPMACPHTPGEACPGNPAPSGGFCLMGGTAAHAFDPTCRSTLEGEFSRLFGAPGQPPESTPTPHPRATPTPVPPVVFGRVAFESNRAGHFEIYVANGDGSGVLRLTYSAGNAYQPSWSPDGSQVAFAATDEGVMQLYTVHADGRARRRLTSTTSQEQMPAWSPDGQWIAFTSDRDGSHQVYRMRPDGSESLRLTHGGGDNLAPAWSPTGAHIAFYSNRDGQLQIYAVSVDGTDETRLTTSPGADVHPVWSPDGGSIVFASNRQGPFALWLMDASGDNQRPLAGSGLYSWRPAWAPGQNWIAFQSRQQGGLGVFLFHPTSGELRRVTMPGYAAAGPVVLPAAR
jgi:TolB protein